VPSKEDGECHFRHSLVLAGATEAFQHRQGQTNDSFCRWNLSLLYEDVSLGVTPTDSNILRLRGPVQSENDCLSLETWTDDSLASSFAYRWKGIIPVENEVCLFPPSCRKLLCHRILLLIG